METRARVYLLWAILVGGGFLITHYYQVRAVNGLWVAISLVGLGYMYKVMPLRVRQMRLIFLSWLIPITVGMLLSVVMFMVPALLPYTRDLGIIWLGIMAIGYLANGVVDSPPRTWYFVAVFLNALAMFACLFIASMRDIQYIVAAIVSFWSMFNLWLLRSDIS